MCGGMGSFFEATVQTIVIIALFIPVILTLAESVAVQSMTLAIERGDEQEKKLSGDVCAGGANDGVDAGGVQRDCRGAGVAVLAEADGVGDDRVLYYGDDVAGGDFRAGGAEDYSFDEAEIRGLHRGRSRWRWWM